MHLNLASVRTALLASFALACGSGGGSTDTASGGSSSTSTGQPTTGGGASGTTTTTGEAASSSGGGTGTGTGTSAGRTTDATGPVLTTSSETTTSTGSSSSGAGPSTTSETGGGGLCGVADGEYGECAAVLGVAFDGAACSTFSGCSCEPDCDLFFPSAEACAQACAADGKCAADKIVAGGLARDPVQVGSFCDQVDACPQDAAHKQQLQALFPGMVCEPGGPCPSGEICHLKFAGILDRATWAELCAATLLPGLDPLRCMVFGP